MFGVLLQIKNNAITSLLGLLSHENADISVDAVAVFSELLNPEVLQTEEEEKGATQIVDHMVRKERIYTIVASLKGFLPASVFSWRTMDWNWWCKICNVSMKNRRKNLKVSTILWRCLNISSS